MTFEFPEEVKRVLSEEEIRVMLDGILEREKITKKEASSLVYWIKSMAFLGIAIDIDLIFTIYRVVLPKKINGAVALGALQQLHSGIIEPSIPGYVLNTTVHDYNSYPEMPIRPGVIPIPGPEVVEADVVIRARVSHVNYESRKLLIPNTNVRIVEGQ